MKKPHGDLTEIQHEIVALLWSAGTPMTHSEIWRGVGVSRGLARTTIQTIVVRLEHKGWLKRGEEDGVLTFSAVQAPAVATDTMAARLVDRFFGGSPARLFLSLAGSGQIDADELVRLRQLLDEMEAPHES